MLTGFGAHRDARGALLRALTDMNQMLQMADGLDQRLAQGAEPPRPNELDAVWWAMESMDGQSHLLPTGPDTTPDTHAHDWDRSGKANVDRAVALAAERGMDFIVLDQTRPDIGLSVVKVLVPGPWVMTRCIVSRSSTVAKSSGLSPRRIEVRFRLVCASGIR